MGGQRAGSDGGEGFALSAERVGPSSITSLVMQIPSFHDPYAL